jgi:hypothetical protein
MLRDGGLLRYVFDFGVFQQAGALKYPIAKWFICDKSQKGARRGKPYTIVHPTPLIGDRPKFNQDPFARIEPVTGEQCLEPPKALWVDRE